MDDGNLQPARTASPRKIFGSALALSVIFHLALVPFVPRLEAAPEQQASAQPLHFDPKRTLPTPLPTPTPLRAPATSPPRSRATPLAMRSAPVAAQRPRPHAPHVSGVRIARTTTGHSPSTGGTNNDAGGGQGGVGTGPSETGNGTVPVVATTPAPATPTPTPPPTATPKPACAAPNVDARVVGKVDPVYPEMARQQGVAGTATVKVSLDIAGAVTATVIAQSSGSAALDREALRAAHASTYAPEVSNCAKVAGSYLFVAEFDAQ